MGALLAGPGRHADVVLLDLELGDGSTAEGNVTAIRAAGPEVLVLSASDRPPVVRAAIRAGARGYALKNEQADQIRFAIREVAAGRDWISPRLAYIFATMTPKTGRLSVIRKGVRCNSTRPACQ